MTIRFHTSLSVWVWVGACVDWPMAKNRLQWIAWIWLSSVCVWNVTWREEKHDTFELMLILCGSVYAMMHIKHDGTFELCSAEALTHFKLKFYTKTQTHRRTHDQTCMYMQYEMSYSNYRYDSLGWAEWKFCRLMEDGGRVKRSSGKKHTNARTQRLKKCILQATHRTTYFIALKQHLSHWLWKLKYLQHYEKWTALSEQTSTQTHIHTHTHSHVYLLHKNNSVSPSDVCYVLQSFFLCSFNLLHEWIALWNYCIAISMYVLS